MYWGTPDANIDWCEQNYAWSPYVAEFWNTLSSIPLVWFGVFGLLMAQRHALNELRFKIAFVALAVVGVGSTCFHLTMRRYAQSLDELPMMWATIVLFYNTLVAKATRPGVSSMGTHITHLDLSASLPCCCRRPVLVPLSTLRTVLVVSGIVQTLIYFVVPQFFLVFFVLYSTYLVSFAAIVFYDIFVVHGRTRFPLAARLYVYAFFGYFGGFFWWLLENALCDQLPSWMQLHALWHIMAGLGTYFTIQCQIAWRAEHHRSAVDVSFESVEPAKSSASLAALPYVAVRIKQEQ